MNVKMRILLSAQKRILPISLALTLFASSVMVSVSAVPPTNDAYTYKISEFSAANVGANARSISGVPNLFSWTSQANTAKYFYLDNAAPGYTGQVLRDGEANKTSGARDTVIEPLSYVDADESLVYPVTEVSGKRTLTYLGVSGTGSNSNSKATTTFFTHKKTEKELDANGNETTNVIETYYGTNISLVSNATEGLLLYKGATVGQSATMTLTRNSAGAVISSAVNTIASSITPFYATSGTSLQSFLIDGNGSSVTDPAILAAAAADFKTKTSALADAEKWVNYRMFYMGTTAFVDLTLNLSIGSEIKPYTLRFPLVTPTDSTFAKNLAVGSHYSGVGTSNYRYPDYYADFTVKYDASAYHEGNAGEFDEAVNALAPYSLKANPNLLDDLEVLYAQYNEMSPSQKAAVTNIATLENAIEAIHAGKSFYDSGKTAGYWAEKGKQGSYAYYEPNNMLPDNSQLVSVSGKMYLDPGVATLNGPIFKYASETNWYWVGLKSTNPSVFFTGGRNGTTIDVSQASKAPVAANYLEGNSSITFKQGTWVDFSYEYNFLIGCYIYTASGVNSSGEPVKIVYKTPEASALFPSARLVCQAGNFAGIFRDLSVGILDSNYAGALIRELPDPADVTVEDEDEITAVRQIVQNRLSSEEYAKISAEAKTRMDNIFAALAAAIEARDNNLDSNATITFENGAPGKTYFEAVRANAVSGWDVVNNPFPGLGNTSEKVLSLTQNYAPVSGDASTNYAIYKLKDGVVPGTKPLNNFSGKVYAAKSGTPIIVYDYKDPDNWKGFRVNIDANNNMIFQQYNKLGAGVSVNQTKTYAVNFSYENFGGVLPSANLWVEFNIEYTLLQCNISIRFYDSQNKVYIGGYDRTTALMDTFETKVGFAVAGANPKAEYIDDVSVNFQIGQAYSDSKNFLENNKYILNLIPAETYLSYNDFDYVDDVKDAYAVLSADAKKYIPFVGSRIESLDAARAAYQAAPDFEAKKARDLQRLAAKNAVTGEYANYTVTENFENGDLSLFQPAKQALNTGSVGIVDNAVFGSKALRMDGRSVLTLKELLLPDRPQVAKVDYKIYMEGKTVSGNKKGLIFYYNYKSNTSFSGFNFVQTEANVRSSYVKITPPDTTSYNTPTDLVTGNVWNVSLTFTARGSCSMQITDANGATLSLTQSADLDSIFTMASNDMPIYIDDLSVTYRKGNYDVDVESTDINVFYTANTWVKPGDVAMVSGENLKNNVSKVEILALPNNSGAGKGYIDRTYFDYDGVHEDEFSRDPSVAYWDSGAAQPVNIVQWTNNSLKFVVPTKDAHNNPFPNGIYAVKLYSSRDSSYEIIYINAPSVDYTVGTDGGITAPGGKMRVIGKNLAYDLDASKLKVIMVGGGTERQLNVSAVQSNYSISVDIPADTVYGDYELWVYSGYGNGTAWSIPTKFTVARGIRDSWNKTVFNIRDYGATGNTSQNATPFFVNALAAISERGGGILYLPAGQYDLTTGLIIPENCVITGDGPDRTAINFRPYAYAINKLPTALFSFTKNVEISNLAVKGSRVGGVLRGTGSSSDNLYFENLYIAIQPYAGTVTEGTGGTYSGLVSSNELYGMVSMESVNPVLAVESKGSNVQIRNFDASRSLGRNRPLVNDKNGSYYWQVDNFKTCYGWTEAVVSNSIWENSTHGPNSCIGAWGHGFYFANNKLFDRTENNRELYVADRNAPYRDQISPLSENPDNVQYYLAKALNRVGLSDKDMQMYIVNGQGVGQTRQIIAYDEVVVGGVTKYLATINRPFTVAPNRNSTVVIRRPRENIFFVNNDYSNGGAGGFYGGVADVVYDGNTWTNCTSIYQMGIFYDVNWYLSIVNDVVNAGPNGTRGNDWRAQSGQNAQMAFLMRDCRINGMFNSIKPGGKNSLVDVIMDRNTWNGSDYAITFDGYTTSGRYEDIDGFLMARNVLEATPQLFDPASIAVPQAAMITTNSAASKRLVMLDIPSEGVNLNMGDVNLDGKISLKDSSLVLFAVVGKVELSNAQKILADVNGDGVVNTKDATMIRMYLIGSVTKFALPIDNS